MGTMAAVPFKAGPPITGKALVPFFTRSSPVRTPGQGMATNGRRHPGMTCPMLRFTSMAPHVSSAAVSSARTAGLGRPAMARSAAYKDLLLFCRRHVDLQRVTSAICRSFC
jgi:hypothetical protein